MAALDEPRDRLLRALCLVITIAASAKGNALADPQTRAIDDGQLP